VLAWALYALVGLLFATYPWLDRLVRDAGRPDLALLNPFVVAPSLAALTASTVGAVLASRRPRHPVGWLLLALGLSMAIGGMAAGYLPYTLIVRPGALPAADLLARIYSPSAETALAALGFVLLLTPTGSAPVGPSAPVGDRRRRRHGAAPVAATVARGRWTRAPWPSRGRSAPAPSAAPYRRRHDAARTIAAFGTRLRDQVELDTLTGELLAVADQTMQPIRASLWLRPPAAPAGR
jgi:hypothetical protein